MVTGDNLLRHDNNRSIIGEKFGSNGCKIRCLGRNGRRKEVIIASLNQLMLGIAAAGLFLHATVITLMVALNAVRYSGYFAHAVMNIHRHTAGERDIHYRKEKNNTFFHPAKVNYTPEKGKLKTRFN